METVLDLLPETEPKKDLELRRSRRLRGTYHLGGDAHCALLGTALAALGDEPSRFENLPDAPWFFAYRSFLESMGVVFEKAPDREGHWLVSSGAGLTAPLGCRPSHLEISELIYMGIASGLGFTTPLETESHLIPVDVRHLLRTLFPEIEGASGLLISKARSRCRLLDMKMDNGLAKIPILFHHLAAKEGLELNLRSQGSDLLENAFRLFGIGLKVEKQDGKSDDELSRRIAKQMRSAGKLNPHEGAIRLLLPPGEKPKATFWGLPGDVGEASVAVLAATLIKGSDILIENVLLNSGRTGFFAAMRRMGADIEVLQRKERFGEPIGNLRVRSSNLLGKRFDVETLVELREEVFLLLVAAACAEGESVFRDIEFLQDLDQNYLKSFIATVKQMGVEIGEMEDGLVLRGKEEVDGGTWDALGHPGLAAAYSVLALKAHGASTLVGCEILDWRYPDLLNKLDKLSLQEKSI